MGDDLISEGSQEQSVGAESTSVDLGSELDKVIAERESSASPEKQEQEQTNPAELKPEDVLAKVLEEKPEEVKAASELVEKLNGLGMIHNGQPLKLQSDEQIKELIQKGHDYTHKTMEHANAVKAYQEERTKLDDGYKQKEQQFKEWEGKLQYVSKENDIAAKILNDWKVSDPDLFNVFANRFQQEVQLEEQQSQFLKPLQEKQAALEGELSKFKQSQVQQELGSIRQGFEKELSDLQGVKGPALSKLGINVNWDKVKDAWAKSDLTVGQILNATHGNEIVAAYESRQKLLETKAKAAAVKNSRNPLASGGSPFPGNFKAPQRAGDYTNIMNQLMQGMED